MDKHRNSRQNADEQAITNCRKAPAISKTHLDNSTPFVYISKHRFQRGPAAILVPSLIVGAVAGYQIIMSLLNRRILCAEIKQRLFDVTSV